MNFGKIVCRLMFINFKLLFFYLKNYRFSCEIGIGRNVILK